MDVLSLVPVEFVCDETRVEDIVVIVEVLLKLEDEETRLVEEVWLGD